MFLWGKKTLTKNYHPVCPDENGSKTYLQSRQIYIEKRSTLGTGKPPQQVQYKQGHIAFSYSNVVSEAIVPGECSQLALKFVCDSMIQKLLLI